VVIGPFESRSAMARARSLTAQQDIDTLLVQRSPAEAPRHRRRIPAPARCRQRAA
jgi:hypothetical protein